MKRHFLHDHFFYLDRGLIWYSLFFKQAERASTEHSKRLGEKEKQIVSLQAKIQQVTGENKVQNSDLERLRKRVSEQDHQIRGLGNELQQQQLHTDDLKENSLIKDAEVIYNSSFQFIFS